MLRALKALDGVVCPERAVFDGTEDGVQLVELHLVAMQITEDIPGQGSQLLRGCPQPPKHGVGGDLEHPGRGANASARGHTGQHADNQLHGDVLSIKERAMRLRTIALARGTLKLSPRTATGMPVGAQLA
jgi:hypothetical protein